MLNHQSQSRAHVERADPARWSIFQTVLGLQYPELAGDSVQWPDGVRGLAQALGYVTSNDRPAAAHPDWQSPQLPALSCALTIAEADGLALPRKK